MKKKEPQVLKDSNNINIPHNSVFTKTKTSISTNSRLTDKNYLSTIDFKNSIFPQGILSNKKETDSIVIEADRKKLTFEIFEYKSKKKLQNELFRNLCKKENYSLFNQDSKHNSNTKNKIETQDIFLTENDLESQVFNNKEADNSGKIEKDSIIILNKAKKIKTKVLSSENKNESPNKGHSSNVNKKSLDPFSYNKSNNDNKIYDKSSEENLKSNSILLNKNANEPNSTIKCEYYENINSNERKSSNVERFKTEQYYVNTNNTNKTLSYCDNSMLNKNIAISKNFSIYKNNESQNDAKKNIILQNLNKTQTNKNNFSNEKRNLGNSSSDNLLFDFIKSYSTKSLCDNNKTDLIGNSLEKIKKRIFNVDTLKSISEINNNTKHTKESEEEKSKFFISKLKKAEKNGLTQLDRLSPISEKKIRKLKTFITVNDFNHNNINKQALVNSNSPAKVNFFSSAEKVFKNKKKDFYCPFCQHCNNITDDNLNRNFDFLEGKNIIKKAFDYIIKNFGVDKNNNLILPDEFMENFLSKKVKTNNLSSNIISNQNITNFNDRQAIHNKIHDNNLTEIDAQKSIFLTHNGKLGNKLSATNTNHSQANFSNNNSSNTFNLTNQTITDHFSNKKVFNNNTENIEKMGKLNINNCFKTEPNKNNFNNTSNMNTTNFKRVKNLNFSHTNFDTNFGKDKNIESSEIIKKEPKAEIENLLKIYQKNQPLKKNKHVFNIVTNLLDALLMDKIAIQEIVGMEILKKLKENLFSQGLAFEQQDGLVVFDNELDYMFDSEIKDKIKSLFRKKYLHIRNLEKEKNFEMNNFNKVESSKKFLILFLIFIQTLFDLGSEFKERAVLIYKVFKMYFVEQEKKWIYIINQMKRKIFYYKELCKTVIEQKNNHLSKIEKINDTLFANKISYENLQDHKSLIYELLNVINEKRDQIYLLNSEKEILIKELNVWVYDFENIKIDDKMREKLKQLNLEKIIKNVREEFSHKRVSEVEKSLIINADRYLLISGQRNYFYEQKDYYLNEIDKTRVILENCRFKKKNYKKMSKEIKQKLELEITRLEKEITYFREKLSCEKKDLLIQTDLETTGFNKLLKNNAIMKHQRNLTTNRLINYSEKINNNCSKQKPMDKESMLNFIPEFYNEKISFDNQMDFKNQYHMSSDAFLVKFMKERFRISKIYKRNIEQIILSGIKYSQEDNRISLFYNILGLGTKKYRTEIFDSYLLLLKNLPVSFFKIFENFEAANSIIMPLETCMEIYFMKFPNFLLHLENFDKIIRFSHLYKQDKEIETIPFEEKKDIYFLNKFEKKMQPYFNNLLLDFQANKKSHINAIEIAEKIILSNKEFDLSLITVFQLLRRSFVFSGDNLMLQQFFDFFINRHSFKIKILDFILISVEALVGIYEYLEKKLNNIFEKVMMQKSDILFYKDFENALLIVSNNNKENMWKFGDYFKFACQSEDKDYLTKEELINFFLNHKDFLPEILKERKDLLKHSHL